MNKLILLLIILSSIHFSKETTNDLYDIIFDYSFNIIKGMSKNESESSCVNAFIEKKEEMRKDFREIIKILTEEEYSLSLLIHITSLIIKIQEKCDLIKLLLFANDFYGFEKTFIENIGLNTMRQSKIIKKNINDVFEKNILNEKLLYIGKILSLIFNFNI